MDALFWNKNKSLYYH